MQKLARLLPIIVGLCLTILNTSVALALGLGDAEVESYIGQRLNASIPILNVGQADRLKIQLESDSLGISTSSNLDLRQVVAESTKQSAQSQNAIGNGIGSGFSAGIMNARVERIEDQLFLRITSEALVSEPYFSFALTLSENDISVRKEFTLLLDLASPEQQDVQFQTANATEITTLASANNSVDSASYGEVLGPYDWAVAGSIPAKFGAVIDGQSLWRVARRINKAMNVSVDQMMVALYQQNRQAFANASIDSLQAGSFLDIPTYDYVTQVSELEAQRLVKELSNASTAASAARQIAANEQSQALLNSNPVEIGDPIEADGSILANGADGSLPADGSTQSGQISFQTTGVEDGLADSSLGIRVSDPKSQDIISSLASTVGNLTQDLIRKDKQIEYLEDRVRVLEQYQLDSGGTLNNDSQSELLAGEPVISSAQNSIASESLNQSSYGNYKIWWWLLPIGLLGILALMMRDRISRVITEQGLFSGDKAVQFEQSVVEASEQSIDVFQDDKEFSVMEAVQKAMREEEEASVQREDSATLIDPDDQEFDSTLDIESLAVEEELSISEVSVSENSDALVDFFFTGENSEISLMGDDEPFTESTSEVEVNEIEVEADTKTQKMDFQQRIDSLVEEKDFSFARELLDFARHNEINDDRYHFERLRLYLAMNDEDAFYDYYYEIEPKIDKFDQRLVTEIADLVTTLGQRH